MSIAKPSRNPANDGTFVGTMKTVLRKFLQGVDDMLPARAGTYDRDKNRVSATPQVQMVTTEGVSVTRAQVASVPVYMMGSGGYMLSFPISSGDKGFLKACDRDISIWGQSYNDAPPNTQRQHSFEDGVFFPAVQDGYTIDSEDASRPVWQNLAGTVKIALGSDRVIITAPLLEIVASETTISGSLSVDGDISSGGTITADTEIVTQGINLSDHVHSGVESGSSNTGGPV